MNQTLVVMSNALPGRETDYADWYCNQHLGDVLRTPGIVNGVFHDCAGPGEPPRWGFAGRYETDAPFDSIVEAFGRRAGTPLMPATDAIDPASILFAGGAPRGPRIVHREHTGPRALYIVMAEPLDGQADAYNEWYDRRHIHDVLDVPGVLAAQRFDLAREIKGRAPCPWSLMTIYEIDSGKIGEIQAETAARAGGPKMPNPGLSKPGTYIGIFTPLA